jgi:hypothetical protein
MTTFTLWSPPFIFFMGSTGKVGPGLRGLYREEGSVSRLSPYLIWITEAMRKLDNLYTTYCVQYIRVPCLIHGFTFKLHGKYLKCCTTVV